MASPTSKGGSSRTLLETAAAWDAFGTFNSVLKKDKSPSVRERKLTTKASNEALVHLRRGEVDEAVASFTRVLELSPTAPQTHAALANRSMMLLKKGDTAGARRDCEAVLALRPRCARSHARLGLVLTHAGDLDGGLLSCIRAVRLAPADDVAHELLAEARRLFERRWRQTDAWRAEEAWRAAFEDRARVREEAEATYRHFVDASAQRTKACCVKAAVVLTGTPPSRCRSLQRELRATDVDSQASAAAAERPKSEPESVLQVPLEALNRVRECAEAAERQAASCAPCQPLPRHVTACSESMRRPTGGRVEGWGWDRMRARAASSDTAAAAASSAPLSEGPRSFRQDAGEAKYATVGTIAANATNGIIFRSGGRVQASPPAAAGRFSHHVMRSGVTYDPIVELLFGGVAADGGACGAGASNSGSAGVDKATAAAAAAAAAGGVLWTRPPRSQRIGSRDDGPSPITAPAPGSADESTNLAPLRKCVGDDGGALAPPSPADVPGTTAAASPASSAAFSPPSTAAESDLKLEGFKQLASAEAAAGLEGTAATAIAAAEVAAAAGAAAARAAAAAAEESEAARAAVAPPAPAPPPPKAVAPRAPSPPTAAGKAAADSCDVGGAEGSRAPVDTIAARGLRSRTVTGTISDHSSEFADSSAPDWGDSSGASGTSGTETDPLTEETWRWMPLRGADSVGSTGSAESRRSGGSVRSGGSRRSGGSGHSGGSTPGGQSSSTGCESAASFLCEGVGAATAGCWTWSAADQTAPAAVKRVLLRPPSFASTVVAGCGAAEPDTDDGGNSDAGGNSDSAADVDVRGWLEALVGNRSKSSFEEWLADGRVLVDFADALSPGSMTDRKSGGRSRDPEANVLGFLRTCERLGVPNDALFHPRDVLDGGHDGVGLRRVVGCLRFIRANWPLLVPR